MSETEDVNDPGDVREEETVESDEFEPVQVFGDSESMDLRPGSDDCYKCSTCDTNCPVAEVDDEFPGPKFQGPEQWRLKRKDDREVDDSITSCSNCMRCDSACPSDVPLSQMHNTARGEFVSEQMEKLSREYVRNRILANYGTLARLGSKVPRLTNFVMGNSLVQTLNEKLLGITSEREFPEFAEETFREWWEKRGGTAASKERAQEARAQRGGAKIERDEKRVAYFHGCYSNYNTPAVGKATVRVFERFGYEVLVPPQQCSGTPMFANGMLEDARRSAETNVRELAAAIEDGADVIASCTSCSMALRQEYPELFDFEGTASVAARTYEAAEYLRLHEDLDGALADAEVDLDPVGTEVEGEEDGDAEFAYHAPCHARNQGIAGQAVELLDHLDGASAEDVGPSCSGISGTYGWKAEKYDASMEIGAEMIEHMEEADAETGLTECPTCAMQMEHGTGYDVRHPMEVLEDALVDGESA
ncbi:anaerobic glycerol-3-phosphate dehydrogenase subunit C [Halorussus litoreus]|uniref:anaerobic glycerol-3-phosphate dehydrogenase subunit C n=1 Tax=Halorussus litoreus TaxID=1710536 RepID=UPI000E264B02|nr:anaerobic glycerol-3-phosphate dehydrogenase subunit C [Halorussus litoreus]